MYHPHVVHCSTAFLDMATLYSGDSLPRLTADIIEEILSYLDGRDLLNCCNVSKQWDELISSSPRLWKQACRREGIVIPEDMKHSSLKSYYIRLSHRLRQVARNECFVTEDLNIPGDVMSAHYNNGTIVLACKNLTGPHEINIWNVTPFYLSQVFFCRSLVLSMKLNGNILVATMTEGGFQMWDVSSGQRLQRQFDSRHVDRVLCFDFFSDWLIVGGYFTGGRITVWDAMEGVVIKTLDKRESGHSADIYKMTLAPFPMDEASNSSKEGKSFYLFTMDAIHIFVRKMVFAKSVISKENLSIDTLYSIPIGSIDPQNLAPGERTNRDHHSICFSHIMWWKLFDTFGMLFDGEYLYFASALSSGKHSCIVHKWHVKTARMVSDMKGFTPVAAVGVGKKYISLMAMTSNHPFIKFTVVDSATSDIVTSHTLPNSIAADEPSHIWTTGDMSWLDGLDGQNDEGLVYLALVPPKLHLIRWTPRLHDV